MRRRRASVRSRRFLPQDSSCSVHRDHDGHLRHGIPDRSVRFERFGRRNGSCRDLCRASGSDHERLGPRARLPLLRLRLRDAEGAATTPVTSGGFDTWKACSRGRRRRRSVCAAASSCDTDAEDGRALHGADGRYGDIRAERPLLILDARAVGNVPSNPRRLETQELCRQLIGNNTSTFDTGSGGPNAFARPGSPFFPLENAEVQGNRKPRTRGSRNVDVRRCLERAQAVSRIS